MKRIVIADDDFMVRAYLTHLIDWEANGYELSAVVKDGRQTLEALEQHDPDLLLIDIEMPLMNGIELLRIVKERYPAKKVVILSCHDDFAYVREAMRLGADEYFLKDEISAEKMLHILKKFLSEDAQGPKTYDVESERKELLQLLEGNIAETSIIRPDAVMAIRLVEYEEHEVFQRIEKRESFYQMFSKGCKEDSEGFLKCVCIHVRGFLFAFLAEYPKGLSRGQQQELLWNNASRLQQAAKRHFDMQTVIGISEVIRGQKDVDVSWERAKDLLGMSFYENQSIFSDWQHARMSTKLPACAEEFLDCAEGWKARRERKLLLDTCQEVLDAFKKEKTKETVVASWVRNADRIMGMEPRTQLKSFASMTGIIGEYANVCSERLADIEQYSESVAATIKYIQENFALDITLTSAANTVHLASAYLSYIFHKETGITFSEYLQSCRIKHAKELLEKTDEKVRNIGGLVGYNDNRHFSKMFKKATGMSPQEYRNGYRKIR